MKRLLVLLLLAAAVLAIYTYGRRVFSGAQVDPEVRPGLGAPPIEIEKP